MDINTTVSIDMADLANELEDYIRECAEEVINQNDNSFQDDDDVMAMIEDAGILDADDVQQLINESMMDVADNTDTVNEITTEYRDLRNEVEKLRRSMRVLLEEREAGIKRRMIRAYNGGSRAISNAMRKVQNYLPTRKDINND